MPWLGGGWLATSARNPPCHSRSIILDYLRSSRSRRAKCGADPSDAEIFMMPGSLTLHRERSSERSEGSWVTTSATRAMSDWSTSGRHVPVVTSFVLAITSAGSALDVFDAFDVPPPPVPGVP